MIKFVVCAEGNVMDVHSETNDIEMATDLFAQLCADHQFYSVHLYDGDTGEVYAYQTIVHSPEGVTITQWMAN